MKKTTKKAYKFPLASHWGRILTAEGSVAFDFGSVTNNSNNTLILSDRTQESIISLLNGTDEFIPVYNCTHADGVIYSEGKKIITIGGWHKLTNPDKLNLSNRRAIKAQNDFAKYIIKKIHNNNG